MVESTLMFSLSGPTLVRIMLEVRHTAPFSGLGPGHFVSRAPLFDGPIRRAKRESLPPCFSDFPGRTSLPLRSIGPAAVSQLREPFWAKVANLAVRLAAPRISTRRGALRAAIRPSREARCGVLGRRCEAAARKDRRFRSLGNTGRVRRFERAPNNAVGKRGSFSNVGFPNGSMPPAPTRFLRNGLFSNEKRAF
ncbi:hypothetical protein M885DRAFT_119230 [Pelagophyceae sp. CCMP2097]|nr:hypothetical protein M885DRAFT_119230 [Pelagophyceae sp. CCMP2097]